MSHSHRLIILGCLFLSPSSHALDFFLDALYWKVTETVDWASTNNLSTPNQEITYKTLEFDFDPGFRVGVGSRAEWDTKLYYTWYYSKATDSASGNIISGFLPGRLIESFNNFFYTSAQCSLAIEYNMFDWDIGKSFYVTNNLLLRPLLGIRGGWINQTINSNFQGKISVSENLTNNFRGIGPKVGVESSVGLWSEHGYHYSVAADFSTSYLWGKWKINDILQDNTPTTFTTTVGSRNLGALTLQALIGINLNYKCLSMKLGYEIMDWFDQYQVMDDGTGAHDNDLIFQGLTLRMSYVF